MKIEFEIDKEHADLLNKAWKYHNKIKADDSEINTKKDFIKELFIDSIYDYTDDIPTAEKELMELTSQANTKIKDVKNMLHEELTIYEICYTDGDGYYFLLGLFTTPDKAQEQYEIVKKDIYSYIDDSSIDSLEIRQRTVNKLEHGVLDYKMIRSESIIDIESELPPEIE